jgi:hypothetical protein
LFCFDNWANVVRAEWIACWFIRFGWLDLPKDQLYQGSWEICGYEFPTFAMLSGFCTLEIPLCLICLTKLVRSNVRSGWRFIYCWIIDRRKHKYEWSGTCIKIVQFLL